MTISWHDDLIDDLRSWDELEHWLTDGWREVRDQGSGLVLATHFDELLVDEPPGGTATQRRLLHQHGFRRRDSRCWSWTPPDDALLPPPPVTLPARMAAAWARMERDRALDRARSAMAVQVLREVYERSPAGLEVHIVSDDESWDEDEEEGLLPALDCAALEARFGPGRRATM